MILQKLILPALTFSLLIADPEYYSGIGIDKEQNVAREKAKSEIAKQIQSIVNTKFESVKIEKMDIITQDFNKSRTISHSNVLLKNIIFNEEYFEETQLYKVKAKVKISDVEELFLQKYNDIKTLVDTAIEYEYNTNISGALKMYYWAYILTYSYPDRIDLKLPHMNIRGNLKMLLPEKLKKLIQSISIKVENNYIDRDDFIVELKFFYHGEPISNLQFSYYNGTDQDWCDINKGKGHIVISGDFGDIQTTILPIIEYKFESEMNKIPDLLFYYESLEMPSIENTIPVIIDISNFLELDFHVIFRDNACTFKLQTSHIAINKIDWIYGDGRTLKDVMLPTHQYDDFGLYNVSCTINNNSKLTVVKEINILEQNISNIQISKHENVTINLIGNNSKYRSLFEVENISEFASIAEKLSQQGQILFGKGDKFESKEGLFCFVFNVKNESTLNVYLFGDNLYKSLTKDKSTNSLKKLHPDQKMAVIWVELLN